MDDAPAPPPIARDRACGKLILVGEHAVVHGQPAIALPFRALGVRAELRARPGPFGIASHFPPADDRPPFRVEPFRGATPDLLSAVARACLARYGPREEPGWQVELRSELPSGRGLGSSAAVCVALARVLSSASGATPGAEEIAALAMEGERVAHGRPSGIDNTVIAHERPLRFAEGGWTPLAVAGPLDLVVADSGELGDTAEMVAGLRERASRRPASYARWLRRVGEGVDEAARALASGRLEQLGQIMNANHLLLQAMEVSTLRLDELVAAARGAGALGAKLSGAGGGGVAIALARDEAAAARLAEALRAAGAVGVWHTRVGTRT